MAGYSVPGASLTNAKVGTGASSGLVVSSLAVCARQRPLPEADLLLLPLTTYRHPVTPVVLYQDHSKLAIVPAANVLCIGDLNRKSNNPTRCTAAMRVLCCVSCSQRVVFPRVCGDCVCRVFINLSMCSRAKYF